MVPVLVGDAPRFTARDSLPGDIAPLADKEYCYLRRRSLAADLVALEASLMQVVDGLWPASPQPVRPGGTATVGFSCGDVAGVRIGRARASSRALRQLGEGFSVSVGHQGPEGIASAMVIEEWDGTEQWGNAADGSGATAPSA